jgi:hypothetical protein
MTVINFPLILSLLLSGKAIGLPDEFIASSPGSKGGGVIQVSIVNSIYYTQSHLTV